MIDFEDGIFVNGKINKTIKQYSEEINGKTVQGEQEVFYMTLNQGTARDKFISICLEELDFCTHPEYGIKGIEFVCFVPYPVGNHLRVFFSEPTKICNDYHFFIMTMDFNEKLNAMTDKTVEIEIIPRDLEESIGNV